MRKLLKISIALIGWFAVLAQLYLMIENRTASIAETIVRFFSFFTILTNTLVACYFLYQSIDLKQNPKSIFNRADSLTAITIYITIVGLVYQFVLRHVWQPAGLQMIVDELLHTIIPVLVIVYWLFYEDKSRLFWKNIPSFLIYPLLYLAYILIRGGFSGFYPYHFINVMNLGWSTVMQNAFLLIGTFLIFSFVFVGLGRYQSKQ